MLKNAVCSQIPRLSGAGLALSTIKPLQSSANINSCHCACTELNTSTEQAACRDLGTPAGPVLPWDLPGVSVPSCRWMLPAQGSSQLTHVNSLRGTKKQSRE